MTVIYSTSEHDTAEITELRQAINDSDNTFSKLERAHRLEQRERMDRYDALLAAGRPSFPTPGHLEAFDQVAALVHEDTSYGDHLGCPTDADILAGRALPKSVHFAAASGRVNVYAGAPRKARRGDHAWQFTDADIDALRAELRQRSLKILSQWIHEDGVAFIVASNRPA
ncbi:hypothetical protein [Microbacterium murale]|uniref:Uncharacterized protein n=1 Tax=Microbacterium murale TaxID=1081040 RepID=A0ABQ1RPJ6_9MICO|nr:hypothetical protein [Microbacterium murale]GGD76910.1 hypothetical protein GCM10007269_19800 [Microbacterium murale]